MPPELQVMLVEAVVLSMVIGGILGAVIALNWRKWSEWWTR